MTYAEYSLAIKQEVRCTDIALGRITSAQWGKNTVMEVLHPVSTEALTKIMVEHMKFAGIFTAGQQLADWCYEEIKRRKA